MSLLYKTEFYIGSEKFSPSIEEVSEFVRVYMSSLAGANLPQEDNFKVRKKDIKVAGINTITDRKYIGFELTHKDKFKENLEWTVSVGIADYKNPLIEIELSNKYNEKYLSPSQFNSSTRPRLVPELIKEFGAYREYPLLISPSEIKKEDSEEFVKKIYDSKRELPIILISSETFTDNPVIIPKKIAWESTGLAHVFYTKNRWAVFKTNELLEEDLKCYNGAVRLYWPMRNNSHKSFHPLWTAKHLKSKFRSSEMFSKMLLRILSEVSVNKKSLTSFSQVEKENAKAKRIELEKSGDWKHLAVSYSEENTQLKKTNQELQEKLDKQSEMVIGCQYQIESLTEAVQDKRENTLEIILLSSPINAIEEFERVYPSSRVYIANRARKQARNSIFKKPEIIFKTLKWLNGEYLQIKEGKLRETLEESCKNKTSLEYKPKQSDATKGKFEEDYYVQVGQEKFELDEHLCEGISRDPRYTIRIGIAYDSKNKKSILGSIMQHPKCKKT